MSTEELLRVEDLTVHYTTLIGDVKAAEDIYSVSYTHLTLPTKA